MPFYGLAAVSKILSDREVFALRKENEKLKKINAKLNWNLFWTKYNIEI
jgi:cell division protein FtsB